MPEYHFGYERLALARTPAFTTCLIVAGASGPILQASGLPVFVAARNRYAHGTESFPESGVHGADPDVA